MGAFRDSAHAAKIFGGFFREEATLDERTFSGSGLVIAYTLHDPSLRIVLDARSKPEPGHAYDVFIDDPSAPEPVVDISMDCDTFDKLYSGEVQPMALMMSGKTSSKGDITAAMRMLPAMARAIPRYKKYRETNQ
ncbi:MAG TPA: SCP2 sterol-binding domain-containing protein [Alphaproteobacteria bacterium]|nr:SCP2 sterol-binding domain-containing protein [Alphaproteobacteria bacterium]